MKGFSRINHLPPELILNIFQQLVNFASVNALIRTSKIFYDAWLLYLGSISSTVLPRAIHSFDEACQLVHIQEILSTGYGFQTDDPRSAILLRTKRLLNNEHDVSITCDWLEEDMSAEFRTAPETFIYHIHPPHLTVTERQRIEYACYQVWIIASLTEAYGHHTSPNFETMTLRELKKLHKINNWLIDSAHRGQGEEDEPYLIQLVPRSGWGLDYRWFYATEDIYSCYREKLTQLSVQDDASFRHRYDLVKDMYTFVDDCLKKYIEVLPDDI